MTYEEINLIESNPFDWDVLYTVYCYDYCNYPVMPRIYAHLLFRYFLKFDEKYGTALMERVDLPQCVSMAGIGKEVETEEAEIEFWVYEAPILMDNAFVESGWCIVWLSTQDECFDESFYYENTETERRQMFSKDYGAFLDEIEEGSLKTAFQLEEETMYEAKCYLEEGQMGIFWNQQLSDYLNFRNGNEDVVKAACPMEDDAILWLEKDVWEPYMMYGVEARRVLDDWGYGVVVLGCDGYNWTDGSTINPNWIPAALKLKFMLDLANEKIARYMEQEKQMLAA